MKNIVVESGVVAMYNGGFWGEQFEDGNSTHYDFGDFTKAHIGNPQYCTKPTDMTWNPENTNGYNPHYEKLMKSKLVKVIRTTTIELEILKD